ncbi:hypothetical protein L211DRAFT_869527 [Terfezia boudieri ATCC MYA-4762]|uniref:DNA-directed RNA polymerase III subunit RPC9 n=1 Tax=Terfezia boudieri ATCC MYA-4762 TaxID=1051890 RepID=A0A3N4LK75_9PEZI|nr:hypothetical protein L211DRAFT_869527 [Terfezia boudieri ATCC MYA-4762]
MKVITPRSAHLTNHEVLSHIQSLRQKYTHVHLTHGPARALKAGNLETVMHEVTTYLTSLPNHDPSTWPPLDSSPKATTTIDPQNSSPKVPVTLNDLEKRIAGFLSSLPPHIYFEKPELLMMINNRPESQAELYLVVEDVEARMNEEEQGVVLDCVKKYFGGMEE